MGTSPPLLTVTNVKPSATTAELMTCGLRMEVTQTVVLSSLNTYTRR